MPVDLKFTNRDMPVKFTYPDNVTFGPKLGDVIQVIDPTKSFLSDYIVVRLSNDGYTLQMVSDCKVDEKEILEILQEN